jgi:hypothetical protein
MVTEDPMRLPRSFPARPLISLAVSLAVTMMLSLNSYALPAASDPISGPVNESTLSQDATGVLTVKKGKVTINGNGSQTGATVLSGSLIVTGSNGVAIIDLGPLGKVEVRDSTTVVLTFAPGLVHIKSDCERTRIEVTRGGVDIKSPKTETILAGDDETYGGDVEATTNGGADFIVDCSDRPPAFILAGWWGLAALIGVGTAIVVGIVEGGEDPSPRVSPVI